MEEDVAPPDPTPGSAANPFVFREPDPAPGSAANPFVLPDTPPRKKKRKKGVWGGPPSSIRTSPLRRSVAAARGLQDEDARAHQARGEDADILVTAQARIRALEASVLSEVPANFAGSSRNGGSTSSRHASGSGTRNTRTPWGAAAVERRHVSMVAALEAPRAPPAPAGAVGGWRRPRHPALKITDLQHGPEPGDQKPLVDREHTVCGICHCVKSHPVSYVCGHSHCYVCIRMWLEYKWWCPVCKAVMERAPFRQYAEEKALEADYPKRIDNSIVDYSFDGLIFPVVPS